MPRVHFLLGMHTTQLRFVTLRTIFHRFVGADEPDAWRSSLVILVKRTRLWSICSSWTLSPHVGGRFVQEDNAAMSCRCKMGEDSGSKQTDAFDAFEVIVALGDSGAPMRVLRFSNCLFWVFGIPDLHFQHYLLVQGKERYEVADWTLS